MLSAVFLREEEKLWVLADLKAGSKLQRFLEAGDKHSEYPYLKSRSVLTDLRMVLSALEDLPSVPL